MKTDILNFKRLGLLFQRYFIERSRTELIYWIIMVIVFMFIRNVTQVMIGLIVIAGAFYASHFFREIHSPDNGVAYFMIPATQLEKTILGVVMIFFYYFIMILIAYIVGNLLGTFLNNMLASINMSPFHHSPLQWWLYSSISVKTVWTNVNVNGSDNLIRIESTNYLLRTFHLFLIGQSIYMLGSIYFKRNQFLATFLVTNVIGLILLIVFATEARLLYDNFTVTPNHSLGYDFSHTVESILKSVIWLIPPFFWVVSYFRLTEKQV